jgi:hypothetical protein
MRYRHADQGFRIRGRDDLGRADRDARLSDDRGAGSMDGGNGAAGGEPLSEHAFGNALDISGFSFANGRSITVLKDWKKGSEEARGFLREVYAGGCRHFRTALGPGARFHDDHFHFDLAHRGRGGTDQYCNPKADSLPVERAPFRGDVMASYPGDGVSTIPERQWNARDAFSDPVVASRNRPVEIESLAPRRAGPRPQLEIPMSLFELQ